MITNSFDNKSKAIIDPVVRGEFTENDVTIITFSNQIEEYVVKNYNATQINEFSCANGKFPIYIFNYNGKRIAFYKSILSSPIAVGMIEDIMPQLSSKKIIVFGSAGMLDKTCQGNVIIPTHAYRDEGTSYHYLEASDYITIKNANKVADFMKKYNIPHKLGKCWTTDAFYRETQNNFNKRRKDGCIAVDMECSAMQAVCDFRNLDLYYFFLTGDLLDSPKWDKTGLDKANHNYQNFEIALHLAIEL